MNSDAGTAEASPEDLVGLMSAWLDCFVSAAREQDASKFKRLFHGDAILFGNHKGGCVDWPLAIQFSFDREHARIFPVNGVVLCVVDWSMLPIVAGGDVKRGHATFFCALRSNKCTWEFLCAHAHFSSL